jgi:hypothetical protein
VSPRALRPLRQLPLGLPALLAVLLALQTGWHATQPPPRATAQGLPPAPPLAWLRVLGAGDEVLAAKAVMVWLLAFDQQPGLSLPYRSLDYTRLRDWLARALALDPQAQTPLLAASRLYGEVSDPARSRVMLAFVADAFAEDPGRRWPWLAHAVFVAQHRLHDAPLALTYARQLATAEALAIPGWARQMEIFVLENIGEYEAAQVMLGGLLESGAVEDARERDFLTRRLAALAARQADVEKSSEASD